jgi:hypothetical protein
VNLHGSGCSVELQDTTGVPTRTNPEQQSLLAKDRRPRGEMSLRPVEAVGAIRFESGRLAEADANGCLNRVVALSRGDLTQT